MNLPNTPSIQPQTRAQSKVTRRTKGLLLGLAASALAGVAALGPGCSKSDTATTGGTTPSGGTTVGFIYVGTKDDYGYNEAHAQGADAVRKECPNVNVIEDESVQENKDCETAMETMINLRGAKLIFPTSFGYFPHVKDVAKKYPNVTFLHAGGQVKDGDPPNVGSYFAYLDEMEYLCGIVAGSTTKSNKLGYIAAKPIPPVLRDINAYELGAKSVNPKATLTVVFTGGWFDPVKEADAVTNLNNQGIDVVSGHVDSPKAFITTADKLGMYSCGYHFNGSALAPQHYLTGAEWNWGPMYVKFVNDILKDPKSKPVNFMGSIRDGSVALSPYGPAVSDAAKKAVDPIMAAMKAGTFKMFQGPLKDNTGKEILPVGKDYEDEDPVLWSMDYLVEGVVGSTK